MLRDLFANALGHGTGKFDFGVRQHNHKFVSSIACYGVGIENGREDDCRHFHQYVGPCQMAMSVVYSFEVIKIEEKRGDTRTITARSPDLVKKKLAQVAAVVQLRQIVRWLKPL